MSRAFPKVQAGRADLGAMARKLASNLSAERKKREAAELSGYKRAEWDTPPTIAVMQRVEANMIVSWETMAMPHGLPLLTVRGTVDDARRNGWTLHELLTRRLHRAIRDALIKARIFNPAEAASRAMKCKVYVAEMEGLGVA